VKIWLGYSCTARNARIVLSSAVA